MKLGFTGTRQKLTQAQSDALRLLFGKDEAQELHHGDCVGADAVAQRLAKASLMRTVSHPPDKPVYRAFTKGNDEEWPEKSYRARNEDIVKCCQRLIACPEGEESSYPRSGTWMTVRIARRARKPVTIVYPDGRVSG